MAATATDPPSCTGVVATIYVGSDPEFAAVDGANGYVYVVNDGSGNVSVINGTTRVGSVNVGSQPQSATYDNANGYVYVPNTGSNNVSVINGTTRVATVAVGSVPIWATYDASDTDMYVANSGFNAETVSVIHNATLVASVNTSRFNPAYTTYDPGNGYVYVDYLGLGSYGEAVSAISDFTVVGNVSIGGSPPGVPVYDSGDGSVYVPVAGAANGGSNNVSVILGTVYVGSVNVGSDPSSPTYDRADGYVYVPNSGSDNVSVISGTTLVGSVHVGSQPQSATYDGANGDVYVPNGGSNNVSVINGTTVVGSIGVGAGARSAVYDRQNGYVYVTNAASGTVSAIPTWCSVTFTETGLPSGTSWSATLNGIPGHSTNSSIVFNDPNGVYSFTVGAVSGYNVSPSSGAVTVNGAPVMQAVSFVGHGFLVGSVTPATATVIASGTIVPVESGAFNVTLVSGRYYLSVTEPGYESQLLETNISAGQTTRVTLVLTATPTAVTLSGEVTPANASIVLNGVEAYVNVTGQFQISLLPGTYALSVSASGYFPYGENLTVSSNTTVSLALHEEPASTSTKTASDVTATGYNVTVADLTSVNGGVSVTFTSGKNGTLLVAIPYVDVENATLADILSSRVYVNDVRYTNFTLTVTSDYTVILTVRGLEGDPTLFWALSPSSSPPPPPSTGLPSTFLGLPGLLGYGLVGGIAGVVVVVGVVVGLRRRRSPPKVRSAPPPPTRPS